MQGDWAAQGIVDAMAALNRIDGLDAIILARGGGSLEDLWPFNEEIVARAIFASRAPVVTGVGHETDVTIADMVADRRAPTPSAAAEMVVPRCRWSSGRRIEARRQAASRSLLNGMQAMRSRVVVPERPRPAQAGRTSTASGSRSTSSWAVSPPSCTATSSE